MVELKQWRLRYNPVLNLVLKFQVGNEDEEMEIIRSCQIGQKRPVKVFVFQKYFQ